MTELLLSVHMYVPHTHARLHTHAWVSSEETKTIEIPVFAARNITPNYTRQVQRSHEYFEKDTGHK